MERHILWSPECGVCSSCGRVSDKVRRFTTDRTHAVYCFPCWNGAQDPHLVSSLDWLEDENVVFKIGEAGDRGTAQGAVRG